MGCTHQGNEVLSPQPLTIQPAKRPKKTTQTHLKVHTQNHSVTFQSEIQRQTKTSTQTFNISKSKAITDHVGFGGHSLGETPGPIPNPEVKPRHVACCTMVRESTGTTPSRQTPTNNIHKLLNNIKHDSTSHISIYPTLLRF